MISATLSTFSTGLFSWLAGYELARHRFGWIWAAAAAVAATAALLKWAYCLTDAHLSLVATEGGVTRWAPLARGRLTIAWQCVGGCRVYTEASGAADVTWLAILDGEGKDVFRVDVTHADGRDVDRLVAMIRERRGTRSELVAAEAPAGLGTELEAEQVPAGRGTEMEAGQVRAGRGTEPEVARGPDAP